MADQHNSNIPALPNQVAEDIPDIKENLEFHKDAFQLILQAWSDTDNSTSKLDTTTGFSDGTYNYEFPTNGIGAHSVLMLGDSDTIVWMYLNAAPPGWKALSTGADTVLGVSGGAGDYNVNGGNADSSATWTIAGLTKDAHTHTGAEHTHQWLATGNSSWQSNGSSAIALDNNTTGSGNGLIIDADGKARTQNNLYVKDAGTGASGAQSDGGVTSDGTWRASASVGKLFQLDTA
jgi:hypothetical protein